MEKKSSEMKSISFGKGIAMICIFLAHAPQCVTWVDNKWTAWGYMSALMFVFLYINENLLVKDRLVSQLGSMSYEFFLVHMFFTIAALPMITQLLLIYALEFWAYVLSVLCTFCSAYAVSWIIWKIRIGNCESAKLVYNLFPKRG